MTPVDYLTAIRNILNHLEGTQLPAIERAADLMVAALSRRGVIYCAGIGHGIQGDFINRAGGLAAVKEYKDECKEGDVVMLGSVSGRNEKPVSIALACREKGVSTVGLTSMAYTQKVKSIHASGLRLYEVVDVVIDNGAPYGDAAVMIKGYEHELLPVSGVADAVTGHMILGRVMEKMSLAGKPASVFMSFNRAGGEEAYKKSLAQYESRGY